MNNVLLSLIYLILTFLVTLIIYIKFGKYGLCALMCVLVIISNIQTIKMVEIFNFTVSLGNISYGAIFLCTDILSEKYGKNSAYNSIKISFVSMIIFAIFIYLFLLYTPSNYDFVQESLIIVFQYIPRITIASLLAYLMSQICDAKIYQYLKNKFNKVYISSNVSTFISQFVDTIIFTIISFFGIVPFPEIVDIALTMLIFKWVIAILDTPFMLWAVKIKNVKEIE